MQNYEDNDGKIKSFISNLKNEKIDDKELYKYELFLLLYWLNLIGKINLIWFIVVMVSLQY
jgi:hypothetical protein